MKSSFFILLTLLLSGQIAAQIEGKDIDPKSNIRSATDSTVKELVHAFMKDSTLVGLSIGIIKNGVTYSFHYGSREKGKDSPPTDSTIYEIGSVSKTFTGTLLAQAIIEGKINPGDDIRKYLPGSYPNLEYQGHPIKIIHLANHTSGLPLLLPDIPNLFQYPQDSIPSLITALYHNYTRDSFWQDLHKIKLQFRPGYETTYSNAGAQLTGFILEQTYNQPYGSLVKNYITGPLTMTHTNVTYTEDSVARYFAKGYNNKGIKMPYNHTLSILQPAGGICSSVIDMLKYIRMHLDEKNAIIALCHLASLGDSTHAPTALFWQVDKLPGGKSIVWHSGASFGFSSYCAVCPGLHLGIVLLSNEYDMASFNKFTDLGNNIMKEISK
jgi:CubicO group peptidase (beta-lactamase class C family)